MKKTTAKKLISFANIDLIEKLVKDEAIMNNISESAVIEKYLLNSMLPTNKDARFWAINLLYSENGDLGKTLKAIFESNSAGIEWKSKHDNLLPIVEFCKNQVYLYGSYLTGEEKELPLCLNYLDSLANRFHAFAEASADDMTKITYQKESDRIIEYTNELSKNPQYFGLINIYFCILNNWDVLKNWSITYRILSALASMDNGWKTNPQTRSELLSIIKDVSAQWDEN